MTYNEQLNAWLAEGERLGFCSSQFCYMHDTPPLLSTEVLWDDNDETCLFAVRLYNEADRDQMEEDRGQP